MADRNGNGQRQAWGEHRKPAAFLQLLVVVGGHVLDPEGQSIAEPPHLVAPAAIDEAERQASKVWVLLVEQVAEEPLGDLRHDNGC